MDCFNIDEQGDWIIFDCWSSSICCLLQHLEDSIFSLILVSKVIRKTAPEITIAPKIEEMLGSPSLFCVCNKKLKTIPVVRIMVTVTGEPFFTAAVIKMK